MDCNSVRVSQTIQTGPLSDCHIPPSLFIQKYALRILFGVTTTEPANFQCPLAPVHASCTHAALLECRNHNRNNTSSLRFNPSHTVNRINYLIQLTTRATMQRATLQENRIYTNFDTWLPKTPPRETWNTDWGAVMTNPAQATTSSLPSLKLPKYDSSGAQAPLPLP